MGGRWVVPYQTSAIAALFLASPLDYRTQALLIHRGGGIAHRFGAFCDHVGLAIPACEVQGCEQSAGLDIGQAVGEDVGYGESDLGG